MADTGDQSTSSGDLFVSGQPLEPLPLQTGRLPSMLNGGKP
jgi:hypothetical protein